MLKWNVYVNQINDKKINLYNVFNHCSYVESLNKVFKQFNEIKKENSLTLEQVPKDWSVKKFNALAKKLESESDRFFENEIRLQTQYYFWAKCEWEVVITSWPPYIDVEQIDQLKAKVEEHDSKYSWKQLRIDVSPTVGEKIDVYDQLRANWEQFILYIKDHEKEIKKLASENKKRYK